MRRTSLPALLVVLALAVTGCGGDDDEGTSAPKTSGETAKPTEAPSEEPSPSSTPTAAGFDNQGSEVHRGKVEATTPQEQAVAKAWFDYWDVRAASYGAATVDPALGSVAAIDALSDVVSYVAFLRSKGLRTVGDTKLSVRAIDLEGSSALLESCMVNKSLDRRADGTPAEKLTPFYQLKGTLAEVGGTWRVVQVETLNSDRCEA